MPRKLTPVQRRTLRAWHLAHPINEPGAIEQTFPGSPIRQAVARRLVEREALEPTGKPGQFRISDDALASLLATPWPEDGGQS